MKPEHELRILDVSPIKIEAKIVNAGGKKIQERPAVVADTIIMLGYDPQAAIGLDVPSVYEQIYKIDIDNMPELKFGSKPKKL